MLAEARCSRRILAIHLRIRVLAAASVRKARIKRIFNDATAQMTPIRR